MSPAFASDSPATCRVTSSRPLSWPSVSDRNLSADQCHTALMSGFQFYPLISHDIAAAIPKENQIVVTRLYQCARFSIV